MVPQVKTPRLLIIGKIKEFTVFILTICLRVVVPRAGAPQSLAPKTAVGATLRVRTLNGVHRYLTGDQGAVPQAQI